MDLRLIYLILIPHQFSVNGLSECFMKELLHDSKYRDIREVLVEVIYILSSKCVDVLFR